MRNHDDILAEARRRFQTAMDATRKNREAAVDDLRFLNGEQWSAALRAEREGQGLPCLTINRLPVFVAQVVNDLRANRPSIKVTAADDKADVQVAEIMAGLIRNIEYTSMADVAYDNAGEIAAAAGYRGYIRVLTRYTSDDAFTQDIVIRPIWNSFCVADDPMIVEPDQSDRRWCVISEWMPKKDFEREYPDASGQWDEADGEVDEDWRTEEAVRVAEYWWIEERPAVIVLLEDGSVIDEEEYKSMVADAAMLGVSIDQAGQPRTRKVRKRVVRWCKMTGSHMLEEPTKWDGQYIPIVHVDPKVLNIQGEQHWSGLVRHAKGPQQLYNYSRSKWAELLALAPRAPWLLTGEQVDGHEADWLAANRKALPYLKYNHSEGQPMPQRVAPPPVPSGIVQDAMQSVDDLKATTGIYDASLGNQGNEQSGRAITARQAQTDKANFSFMDNLTRAIRVLGKILLDLIPHVYDSERVVRVRGEDGKESQVTINQVLGDVRLNDLSLGKYDVVVTAGPSYASQRLEQADAAMELLRTLPPQMAAQFIDLFMESLNFPNFEKWMERAKALLPPQLTGGQAPEPQPDPLAMAKAQLTQQQARKTGAEADVAELNAHKHTADVAAYAMDQAHLAQAPMPQQAAPQAMPIPAPAGQAG